MKWPTNVGYAIEALERLFFQVTLGLAHGDASRIHFTYTASPSGHPKSLPQDFQQYSVLDINDGSTAMLDRLATLLRAHRPEFALTFDMQPVHPMYRVMRDHGVRTIVSYWGAPISGISPAWKLALKRAQILLSRSVVDGLIFESEAMADLAIRGRGVPRSMLDIVYLGVDIERFRPAPSDYVHSALNIPRDRRVIVFTGHCTPRKGIKTLIEAAIEVLAVRKRTDVCFVLCGNQDGESKPYEQMYEGLGIAEWIRFMGYRKDVREIFQSAFCGVIPSSGWDSFTMSSVEMAACGLPIVASRLQGLAEAVLDGRTGLLFEPGNPKALADCIEKLLDDPELAASYGRAGRARCEREFSIEKQHQDFTAAVRRRITGGAPGPVSPLEQVRSDP
jgi:glycosyltransferase involved in cell wall biosynthesis